MLLYCTLLERCLLACLQHDAICLSVYPSIYLSTIAHQLLSTMTTVASILYRISPFSHSTTKLVHLILHSCAIGLILMGLCAVWSFHTAKHITQLYSLHSWCGSLVVSLFLLHYVWSYLVFFSPRLGTNTQRRSWIPVHREAGKSMAFLGALVLLLGIAEKLQFNNSCNLSGWLNGSWVHAYKATDCVYGQTIGLLIMMLIIISFFALSGQQQPNATTAGPDEEDALLH